jgi:RNA polymerase sigma-70 factor (ECF subfamily)
MASIDQHPANSTWARERFEVARSRHAGTELAFDAFAHALRDATELDVIHTDDLYLALCCAAGDERALRIFDEGPMEAARDAIARIDRDADFVAESLQRVRDRLLSAAADGPPRVALYRGRGALAAWVSVTATRVALSLRRQVDRRVRREANLAAALLHVSTGDLETEHLKARFTSELRRGIEHAFGELATRDRTVFRLYLVEGLNIEAIGKLYGVHRATVARWIERGRRRVYELTAGHFHDTLDVSSEEFASLSRVLVSQLDLHFSALLGSSVAEPMVSA